MNAANQARPPKEAIVAEYVKKWGIEVERKPAKRGIWRRRDGGYLARVRAIHPKTKKPVSRIKTLPTLREAADWQADERRAIVAGTEKSRQQIRFTTYTVSLLKEKVARGDVNSRATVEVYTGIAKAHFHPFFGEMFLDKIQPGDVRDWMAGLTGKVAAEELSPRTVNLWLGILKGIFNAAVAEELIDKSPAEHIKQLPTERRRTYTREQPNSLRPDELPRLWAFLETKRPKWYALIVLGMVYGLRPSSLRPLRFRGQAPDVLWGEGLLLIRQSHSRGRVVMDSTKTGEDLELPLDPEILDLLRWHVERYAVEGSDLLFPGRGGRVMSNKTIAYWFAAAEAHMRHKDTCPEARYRPGRKGKETCPGCTDFHKHLTPRAMRRSFYNLTARTAAQDAMIRSISGHKTPGMADRYRSQDVDGQRQVLAEVVSLAKVRSERAGKGVERGEKAPEGDQAADAQRREIV